MKKYASEKTLVSAIRRLESKQPKHPIKGVGFVRKESAYGEMLSYLIGKEIADCNHVCKVFARRSKTAKYNKMQFGSDEIFISPELANIVADNFELIRSLNVAYRGHKTWKEYTA